MADNRRSYRRESLIRARPDQAGMLRALCPTELGLFELGPTDCDRYVRTGLPELAGLHPEMTQRAAFCPNLPRCAPPYSSHRRGQG
ncbi:MAG: hypothetical protein ACK4GC_14225 [Paracoccaceae bacterium]